MYVLLYSLSWAFKGETLRESGRKTLKRSSLRPKIPQTPFSKKEHMPTDAIYADPCAYRYFDYPRPGSIYRLQDIPELVRGPTVVLLPSGKEIKVPAQMKSNVASGAEVHDMNAGHGKMEQLLKILSAKQGPTAPSGYKMGRAPAFQLNRNHPRENTRLASHMGMNLAF